MQWCRLIREIQRRFWCWRNSVESMTQKKGSGLQKKKWMAQAMTHDPHAQGPLVHFLCPVSAVRRGSSLPRLSHALRLAIYCYRFLWWMDGPLLRFKASPTTLRLFHTKQTCHGKGESWNVIFLATIRSTATAKSEMKLALGSIPTCSFYLHRYNAQKALPSPSFVYNKYRYVISQH
jgi:hypothetical protein